MTKNNALKKAIRNRMAETSEPYNVAARNLKLSADSLNVIELGEDGDSWFVEDTLDTELAKTAVKQWLKSVYGDDDYFSEFVKMLNLSNAEARDDWFWRPVHAEFPQDEAVLRNLENDESEYARQDLFSGVYIR